MNKLAKFVLGEFMKVSKDDLRYIEKRSFIVTMLEAQVAPVFLTKGKNVIIKQAEDCEEAQRLLSKLKREIAVEEGRTSRTKILKFERVN